MKTQLIKEQDQARGAFDFGRIKENKPIGFPHERGGLQSFSNLFYWAHAWSDEGGLIAEHPHQGFEIMSYVIRGELSHYDNKNDEWISLKSGSAQLIKAGNGITHAEKFMPNTAIFQIWLDPDLSKTLGVPASYQDVSEDQFIMEQFDGYAIRSIIGEKSPLGAIAEGISMSEITADKGEVDVKLDPSKYQLLYLIHGNAELAENKMAPNDLLMIEDANNIKINFSEKSRVFLISVPTQLSFQSYVESQK